MESGLAGFDGGLSGARCCHGDESCCWGGDFLGGFAVDVGGGGSLLMAGVYFVFVKIYNLVYVELVVISFFPNFFQVF